MAKCFRCKGLVPEPDLKEAISRELDWREQFPDEDDEERVLICMQCSDELEELHEDSA